MAYRPSGKSIPTRYIRNSYSNNHDGFGIMWAQDGRVHSTQGMFNSLEINDLLEKNNDKDYAIHFRYSTGGSVSSINTHPFKVLDFREDGMDLWMMHNGVLTDVKNIPEGRSDTYQFVEGFLKPILSKGRGELVFDPNFKTLVERSIRTWNKLLFMAGDGRVSIFNQNRGHEKDGVWYSNTYSLYSPPAPKGAKKGKETLTIDQAGSLIYDRAAVMYYLSKDNTRHYYTKTSVEEMILSSTMSVKNETIGNIGSAS